MQDVDLPTVTAREVAQWVYCKHSWWLSRRNAPVTEEARKRMNAGVVWQDQRDQHVPAALDRRSRAQKASLVAWIAVIIFLSLVALWLSHSLLQHLR